MIESSLVSYLLASPAVTSVVANRIFPVVIPEDQDVMPCITYQAISSIPQYTLSGPVGLTIARFQLDCWSDNYADCKAAADALRQVLDGFPPGLMSETYVNAIWRDNGATDSFDPNSRLYRSSVDYRLVYAE